MQGFGDENFSAEDRRLSFSKLPPPNSHLPIPHGQRKEGGRAVRPGLSYAAVVAESRSAHGGRGSGDSPYDKGGKVATVIDAATTVTDACSGIGSSATSGAGTHVGGGIGGLVAAVAGLAAAESGVNALVRGEEEERLSVTDSTQAPHTSSSGSHHARDSSEDSGFGPPFDFPAKVVKDCSVVLCARTASSFGAGAAGDAVGGAPSRQHGSGIVNTIARSLAVFSPRCTEHAVAITAAAPGTAATTTVEDEHDRVVYVPVEEGGAAQADASREAEKAVGAQEMAVDKSVESGSVLPPLAAEVEGRNMLERWPVPLTREVVGDVMERGRVAAEGFGTSVDGGGANESSGSGIAAADSSGMERRQSTSLTSPRQCTHRTGSVDMTTSEVRGEKMRCCGSGAVRVYGMCMVCVWGR